MEPEVDDGEAEAIDDEVVEDQEPEEPEVKPSEPVSRKRKPRKE